VTRPVTRCVNEVAPPAFWAALCAGEPPFFSYRCHAEGDRALAGFAQVMKSALRDSDAIGVVAATR